jgi:uncharacterized protein involved in exopolysaccharide biosynthesis
MENTIHKKPAVYDLKSLTLRDMIGPLFRNWLVAMLVFSAIFVVAVLVALGWARHYYVSTMQVVVARERSDPALSGQQNGAADNSTAVTADEVASEVALLQGRDILSEVVRNCDLLRQPSMVPSLLHMHPSEPAAADDPKALEIETQALAGKLRVEAQRMSHVIDVRYGRWGAPETPACVLQKLGSKYLEKHLRLQRPAGAFDFFVRETEKYQQALTESEKRLVEFGRSERVAAPEIVRAGMAQRLATFQANLYESRQRIAADERRIASIDTQLGATPSRSATAETSLSANTLLEQLQASLLNSALKKTQLLMKYDASYPLVQEVDTEIAQTKEAIAAAESSRYSNTTTDRDPTFEYLRQDRARTEADLASEKATETALSTTIHDMQLQVINLDAKTVEHEALLRDSKANEGNYLLYLTKREQERTSDALDQKRIANVAIAVPAAVPALTAYSSSHIIFEGFWIAVFAGIAAGYLWELANPSFRTPAEVEDVLKIAVLAAVPRHAA